MDGDLCWPVDMTPAAARCTGVCLRHAFSFTRVWPEGPDLRVTLFAWGARVKENDSGLWTVFTRKMCPSSVAHVCMRVAGIISGAVIWTGWLVRWADWSNGDRGEWGGGDWVACQWQKCNVLSYWLQEVLIFALKMDGPSPQLWEPLVSMTLYAVENDL